MKYLISRFVLIVQVPPHALPIFVDPETRLKGRGNGLVPITFSDRGQIREIQGQTYRKVIKSGTKGAFSLCGKSSPPERKPKASRQARVSLHINLREMDSVDITESELFRCPFSPLLGLRETGTARGVRRRNDITRRGAWVAGGGRYTLRWIG